MLLSETVSYVVDLCSLTARSSLAEADRRMKGRIMGRQPMASSWQSGNGELVFIPERSSANFRTWKTASKLVKHSRCGMLQHRGQLLLSYFMWRGRFALLPVSKEWAVEGFSVGVLVWTGCGQEVDVVWQNSSSSIRLRDVHKTSGDKCPSHSKGAEDVQRVVTCLKTLKTTEKEHGHNKNRNKQQNEGKTVNCSIGWQYLGDSGSIHLRSSTTPAYHGEWRCRPHWLASHQKTSWCDHCRLQNDREVKNSRINQDGAPQGCVLGPLLFVCLDTGSSDLLHIWEVYF